MTGPNPPLSITRVVRTFGSFAQPTYVVIDKSGGTSNGDLYMQTSRSNEIRKFDSTGNPITSWAKDGTDASMVPPLRIRRIGGIAVGPSGSLIVINQSGQIFQFSSDAALIAHFKVETGYPAAAIAVELGRQHL